jgi:chromosome segregation ATPase
MTTALRQHAGHALAALYEVSKHFEEADSAGERRASLERLCADTEAELHPAQVVLKGTRDELTAAQSQLDAKKRILDDQRARALNEIEGHISAAQGELWDLQEKIRAARQALSETEASTGSLIKRLRIG